MKTNQIMQRVFDDIGIHQRTSDSYFNATDMLAYYNKVNNSSKRFADFWENQNTKQIYLNLCEKLGVHTLHDTRRGKGGCTWMHESLLHVLYNWLHKLPNRTITRDELCFCDYIMESFAGIIKFEKQKLFGGYFVDLYCEELKLCVEFDESHHNYVTNKASDAKRESEIRSRFGVSFLRHKKSDNYSLTINKLLVLWLAKNKTIDEKHRNVAVISFNTQDFKAWKLNSNLKNDGLCFERRFKVGNTTYYCVSRVNDICGVAIHEIIETDRSKENDEYEKIKSIIRCNLR